MTKSVNRQIPRMGENWYQKKSINGSSASAPVQLACQSGAEITLETTSQTTQFVRLPLNPVAKNFRVTLWYGDPFGSTFVILGNQGTEIARMFGTPVRLDFIFINNEYRF